MKLRLLSLFFLLQRVVMAQSGASWVKMEPQGLYDLESPTDTFACNGFKSVNIYSDDTGSEVWVSKETHCVTLERVSKPVTEGSYALHIKWDKVTGGCAWIGMGFGWEDWQAKDMSGLLYDASVQLKVRAVKGSFSNLPVAFAFEDYTGVQTYCGFNAKQASGRFTDQAWTTVTIPLADFPFIRNGAELSKIKQFMIQLEGAGDVYVDDIRLIPHSR